MTDLKPFYDAFMAGPDAIRALTMNDVPFFLTPQSRHPLQPLLEVVIQGRYLDRAAAMIEAGWFDSPRVSANWSVLAQFIQADWVDGVKLDAIGFDMHPRTQIHWALEADAVNVLKLLYAKDSSQFSGIHLIIALGDGRRQAFRYLLGLKLTDSTLRLLADAFQRKQVRGDTYYWDSIFEVLERDKIVRLAEAQMFIPVPHNLYHADFLLALARWDSRLARPVYELACRKNDLKALVEMLQTEMPEDILRTKPVPRGLDWDKELLF